MSIVEYPNFFWSLGAIFFMGSIEPRLAFISGFVVWCVTLALGMN